MRPEHSKKTKRNVQKKLLNPPTTPKYQVRNILQKFNFLKTKLRSPEVQNKSTISPGPEPPPTVDPERSTNLQSTRN